MARRREELERAPAKQAPEPAEARHEEPAAGLAGLQQLGGNRLTSWLLSAQATLEVGRADDPLEAEADAAAARVVELLAGGGADAARTPATTVDGLARSLRRRPAAPVGPEGGVVVDEVEASIRGARGGGRPLDAPVAERMAAAFGADFGAVRVHDGPQAADLNRALGARAFTIGRDIFFAGPVPDASTADGQRLLAHELAHTVQQGASPVARTVRRADGDPPGGDSKLPASGSLGSQSTELNDDVRKGPDDRSKGDATRSARRTGQAPGAKADGGGLRLRVGRLGYADRAERVNDESTVPSSSSYDLPWAGAITTAWSNPGGDTVSPFGAENFGAKWDGASFTTKGTDITLNFNINVKCSWGTNSGGKPDVSTADSTYVNTKVMKDGRMQYQAIADDLTPALKEKSWVAPRQLVWSQAICERHEKFHSTDDRDWAAGPGKQVVADFIDKETVSGDPKTLNAELVSILNESMKEMENANMAFYKGGAGSYYSYAGEERAFGDGKGPYEALVAAIRDKGDKMAAAEQAAKNPPPGPPVPPTNVVPPPGPPPPTVGGNVKNLAKRFEQIAQNQKPTTPPKGGKP